MIAAVAATSILLVAASWIGDIMKPQSSREKEEIEGLGRAIGITHYYLDENGFFADKVELTPDYRAVVDEVEIAARNEAGKVPVRLGKNSVYEGIKKKILKEQHGIDWRGKGEMNPHMCID